MTSYSCPSEAEILREKLSFEHGVMSFFEVLSIDFKASLIVNRNLSAVLAS
jgi:hypothetical protein